MNAGYPDERRRLLLAVDIVQYGRRTRDEQYNAQELLVRALARAYDAAGLDRDVVEVEKLRQPGGDAVVDLVPPDIPEARVVAGLVHGLHHALLSLNDLLNDHGRLRLRAAISQGLAAPGPTGMTGEDVVTVCRIRDSDVARDMLRATPTAHLLVLLTDDIYRGTVVPGRYGLRRPDFVRVRVREKELDTIAWLHIPGHAVSASDQPSGHGPTDAVPISQMWVSPGGLRLPPGLSPATGPFTPNDLDLPGRHPGAF